jgi:small subunit ribosomal protein S20
MVSSVFLEKCRENLNFLEISLTFLRNIHLNTLQGASMANLKSSQKDIRRTAKRTLRNKMVKTRLKTLTRKVRTRGQNGELVASREAAIAYISALDKAVKQGVIHRNKANRCKSKVSSIIFEQEISA